MHNALYIGDAEIELPKGSFLDICDEVPDVAVSTKARVFDPLQGHAFNPLKGITKKTARDLARALYSGAPEGASTLTVRNGRRALARALARSSRLDALTIESKIKGVAEEVEEMVDELLFTEVARACLCGESDFAFSGHNRKVFARFNRAELGDDDALAFGLFLLARYKEQVIVEDAGFYLRDMHVSLIRENRLILRVSHLAELPPKLRKAALSIPHKVARGALYEDAVELAKYDCADPPGTNEYNGFVARAMA